MSSDYAREETAWSAVDETAIHSRPNGAYSDHLFGDLNRPIVRLYHNGECTVLSVDEAREYGRQLLGAVDELAAVPAPEKAA